MVQICPKCSGFDINCPVCGAPPKRVALQAPLFQLFSAEELAILLTLWEVQGIDVSGWNGVMNFLKHKYQYVKVRIGYGNQWKDYRCDAYRQQLLDKDIPYGIYWYIKVGESWEMHADSIAEIASQFPFQLDVTLDCESTILGPLATLNWLIALDGRVQNNMNREPEYYSSAGWWNSKVARSDFFNNRRKWAANWTSAEEPYLPFDWAFWNHWQWSADGNGLAREYGMLYDGDNDMDLDRYNGTVDQFNTYYGTHILPLGELPPPPIEKNFPMIVIVKELNVRDGPGIGYAVRGQIHLNDIVTIKDIAGASAWIQIKEGQWAGKWCAVQTSKRYMNPA